MVLVLVGVATWRGRPRLAAFLGLAGMAVSAPTYGLLGHVPRFPALYLASLIAPSLWLHWTNARAQWTSAAVAGAFAVAGAWLFTWLQAPQLFDRVEGVRIMATMWVITGGIVGASRLIGPSTARTSRDRIIDVGVTVTALGAAAAAWWSGIAAHWVAALLASAGLLAYAAFRRRLRSHLARLSFAQVGHRATLRALEAERSRVARDLHDVPLQELSAVIHRLSKWPDAASEAAQLQEIASHLRSVTVSLRPPVLDDLGLGAAIAELTELRSKMARRSESVLTIGLVSMPIPDRRLA